MEKDPVLVLLGTRPKLILDEDTARKMILQVCYGQTRPVISHGPESYAGVCVDG